MSFLSALNSLCSVVQAPSQPVCMFVREWQEPAAIFVTNDYGGLDPRYPGSFAWNMTAPKGTSLLALFASCL